MQTRLRWPRHREWFQVSTLENACGANARQVKAMSVAIDHPASSGTAIAAIIPLFYREFSGTLKIAFHDTFSVRTFRAAFPNQSTSMTRFLSIRALLIGLILLASPTLVASAQSFTFHSDVFDPAPPTLPEITTVSIADYNGDGRLDFYYPGSLYRQNADGTFLEVRLAAGIDYEGELPLGGIFGDANLDGLLDLVIMDGEPGGRLFLNKTGGKFTLGNLTTNIQLLRPASGAFWRDLNRDGWVDLSITYQNGRHALFTGFGNSRYSDQGNFFNYNSNFSTCNLTPGDYDNDGDVDVYAAGCGSANALLNQTGSNRIRFNDRASNLGVNSGRNTLESHWLDFDNDGDLDLLVVNLNADLNNSENQLFRNDGPQTFVDVAIEAGIGGIRPLDNGPATVADFNNDGWVDLFLPINQLGRLYINNQDGTFTNVFEAAAGFRDVPPANGSGDFNNDGWMDLLFPQWGVLLNDGGDNNWVTFQAKDDEKNRFGVGVTIRVTTDDGLTQMRTIESGSGGFGHSDQLRAHFGLGTATQLTNVELQWSDGLTETYSDIPINKHHTLVRGLGLNTPPSSFEQVMPPVAGYVEAEADSIWFEWTPSQDDEAISYTLSVSGPGVELSFPDIENTFFSLDTVILPENQVYEWSVRATDGHTVRYSGEDRILTYGQADQAVATLRAPVAYEFNLPEVTDGLVLFEDMDNDGDKDLLIGGDTSENGIMAIFANDDSVLPLPTGDGTYVFKTLTATAIYVQAVTHPRASFGDMDGDGFRDLIVSGISSLNGEVETSIYRNDGADFVLLTVDGLVPLWGGAVQWGDMDQDGDDDLLITGGRNLEAPYDPVTIIYENNQGTLLPINHPIPGVVFGDIEWADMDSDGDLDIAITGDRGNGDLYTAVFVRDGAGYSLMSSEFPEVTSGSVAWGDYDNDGDLDLVVTGGKIGPELLHGVTEMYVNEGFSFSKHPFPFDGVLDGGAWWGDYENDGDMDLIVMGATKPYGPSLGRLFRNEDGQFAAELDLEGLASASVSFADYNGDGDLDLVLIGRNENNEQKMIFLINQQIPELIPGQ